MVVDCGGGGLWWWWTVVVVDCGGGGLWWWWTVVVVVTVKFELNNVKRVRLVFCYRRSKKTVYKYLIVYCRVG